MKRIMIVTAAVVTAAVPLLWPEVRAEDERRDTLSVHQTVARYEGTEFIPCRFRTALCPDRCGHARTVAWFGVLRYEKYEKKGQYGDEQGTRFAMLISGPVSPEMNPVHAELVKGLRPGDLVKLDWVHEYVHRDGNSYPERVVTRLERVAGAELEALRKEFGTPAVPEPAAPQGIAPRGMMRGR